MNREEFYDVCAVIIVIVFLPVFFCIDQYYKSTFRRKQIAATKRYEREMKKRNVQDVSLH